MGNYVHDLSGMTGNFGEMNTFVGAEGYKVMNLKYSFEFDLDSMPCGDASDVGAFEYCLEI